MAYACDSSRSAADCRGRLIFAAAVPRVVILRCPRASHNPERATTSARASKDAARAVTLRGAARAKACAERLRVTVHGTAFVTQYDNQPYNSRSRKTGENRRIVTACRERH